MNKYLHYNDNKLVFLSVEFVDWTKKLTVNFYTPFDRKLEADIFRF